MQFNSTYKDVTAQTVRNSLGHRYQKINIHELPATQTSINLGQGHRNPFLTMNQKAYGPKSVTRSNADKDFISNIKANHFEYGNHKMLGDHDALQAQYQSMTKASYNFKGDARDAQAQLDVAKKEDLRRNHF